MKTMVILVFTVYTLNMIDRFTTFLNVANSSNTLQNKTSASAWAPTAWIPGLSKLTGSLASLCSHHFAPFPCMYPSHPYLPAERRRSNILTYLASLSRDDTTISIEWLAKPSSSNTCISIGISHYLLEDEDILSNAKYLYILPNAKAKCIFESCDISFKNAPTSHTVNLALFM